MVFCIRSTSVIRGSLLGRDAVFEVAHGNNNWRKLLPELSADYEARSAGIGSVVWRLVRCQAVCRLSLSPLDRLRVPLTSSTSGNHLGT